MSQVLNKSNLVPTVSNELSQLLRLGIPLIGAQLAQISVNTMDVLMIGWLGAEDLAASVLVFNYYVVLWLAGLGIILAAAPLSAQAYGAHDLRTMRRVIRQAIWIAVAFSLISMYLLSFVVPVLRFLGQEERILMRSGEYMNALKWAFFPGLGFICLRVFLSTTGHTQAVLWATVLMAVLNGILNYGLIFGNLGMPRLELQGAGIASAISAVFSLVLLVLYIFWHRKLRRFSLFGRIWRADFQILKRIVLIGLPIGMTLLSEVGMFSIAAVMIGWIGVNELAAHTIVAQCAAVTFMVPLGIGQAAVVRVGLAAGQGNTKGIGLAGWTAIVVAILFMCLSALAFWLIPDFLISLYQNELNPASEQVKAFGISLMFIAAIFQFFDGAQVVGGCALRGINDTKIPMVYAIIGYWVIGLGGGYILAFPLNLAAEGVWWGLALGLIAVAMALSWRFYRRESLGLVSQFQSKR